MLLLLLILVIVVAVPALAYGEYCRWRGLAVVEPPLDETNRNPPKPATDRPKRLPRITDFSA